MELYVIRRPSAWANLNELEVAGARSAKIGNEQMSDRVRWIRSYVVHEADGRIGTFCIYEARDGESIREHARRVGAGSGSLDTPRSCIRRAVVSTLVSRLPTSPL
jgi:hypothetical protein